MTYGFGSTMIDAILSWTITVLVVAAVAAFVAYLVAVSRMRDERPKVNTFDRTGRMIGLLENPGEEIAPGRKGDPISDRAARNDDSPRER